MSGTFLTGPSIVTGPLVGAVSGSTPQEYGVEYGPSIEYQGDAIPDVRYSMNKDQPYPGSIPAHLNSPYFFMTDCTPAASNTALTNGGNATSGTALVNVTTSATGVTLNVPFYQFNTNTLISNAICLDFGWGQISVTSATATATPAAGTMQFYYPGQWLVIGNVGNSGGTIPLVTQVASVGTTTITLNSSYLPQATSSTAPVGSGNVFNTAIYGSPVATAHTPYIAAGLARILDPKQNCSRGVGITGVSGGTGGAFTIRGFDMYGQPQSETITATAGATTVWGKKTYKWFLSATPAFTDAHGYTVVTSDTFGICCRSDLWEYTDLFFNGTFQTASVSTSSAWTAGDQTSPATLTTGDVRGTFQVSARGANGTVTSTTYTNGTLRMAMAMTIPVSNLINATPNNPVTLYGVTPFTN